MLSLGLALRQNVETKREILNTVNRKPERESYSDPYKPHPKRTNSYNITEIYKNTKQRT